MVGIVPRTRDEGHLSKNMCIIELEKWGTWGRRIWDEGERSSEWEE